MGYLGLLLAAIIVCLLYMADIKRLFVKWTQPSAPVKQAAAEAGIKAQSYPGVVGEVKVQLGSAAQKEADRTRELEGIK